ncbi:MAG TPA: hypothetical protein VKG66_08275 [Steroidobacteraceae bacterium]|nr:hypothetical protein [Steroidobacteraceae bacterium]
MSTLEKLKIWFGPVGARIVLLVAAVLLAAVIVICGALIVLEAMRAGLPWRALLCGVLDLLALGLWLRIVRTRWRQLRALPPPDSVGEPTGIWGVGGPGVRVPGSTGKFRIDRRAAADDDTEGGTGP